jgi:hypothetical protein
VHECLGSLMPVQGHRHAPIAPLVETASYCGSTLVAPVSPTGLTHQALSSPTEESGLHRFRPQAGLAVLCQVLFPWMTWLCLVGADLWFIHRFGTNAPFQNEWRLVPAALGHGSLEYSSLPRSLLTFLYRASGPDFRAGMFASLALLAGLAAAMIMVSRSVRGRADWSDAVYPLLLLHWGHSNTLLVSLQMDMALMTTLAGLILVMVAYNGRTTSRQAVILAIVALLVWCASDFFSRTNVVAQPSGWFQAVEFLAIGTGVPGHQWPMAIGGVVALGFLGGLYILLRRWLKQPGERRRLSGLVLWTGGFALLGACVLEPGLGQQATGAWRRQVTLAAMGPCWIMLVLAIYGRSSFSRFVPRFATLAAIALIWPWPVVIDRGSLNVRIQTNSGEGLEQGEGLKKQFEAMRSEINAGLPEMVIAYRFSRLPNRIGPRMPEHLFAEGLSLLRERRIGMFAALHNDRDWKRVPAGRLEKKSSGYHFALATARHIYGAWVKVDASPSSRAITFEMSWKPLHDLSGSPRNYRTTVRPGNVEDLLIWIDDDIVEADIECDRKALHLLQVDFLIPHSRATGPIQYGQDHPEG